MLLVSCICFKYSYSYIHCFDWVLHHINTVQVIWCLSIFTRGEKPRVLLYYIWKRDFIFCKQQHSSVLKACLLELPIVLKNASLLKVINAYLLIIWKTSFEMYNYNIIFHIKLTITCNYRQ